MPRLPSCLALLLTLCAGAAAAAPPDARLHLIATSDLHGYIVPTAGPAGLAMGGAGTMAAYVAAARARDPETVLLDAGDTYQGTIVSNQSEGAAMTRYLNHVGVAAVAVGNHEFDFGPVGPDSVALHPGQDGLGALKARIATSRFPFLGANICALDEDPCSDPATARTASFVRPTTMITVHGVKLGIIGLSTTSTPDTTMRQNVERLRFFPLAATLERYIPQLKREGADVVVAIAHAGGACRGQSCNAGDELFAAIDQLSPSARGALSLVLGGHTHNYVNAVHNGVPVMIPGRYGQSFSYVTIDVQDGRVRVKGETVDFCQRVYSDSGNCRSGSGATRAPAFLGTTIAPSNVALAAVEGDLASAAALGDAVVGHTHGALARNFPDASIGHFVTDALRRCPFDGACQGGVDVAIINNGGLRAEIAAGPVTYNAVFELMPFDNYVATVKLTGSQLRDVFALIYANEKRLPQVSGLTVRYRHAPTAMRTIGNGRGERITIPDPIVSLSPIDDGKLYTVAMADFLATGGAGLAFLTASLQPAPVLSKTHKVRDAVVDYLRAQKEGVRYDGDAPRLIEEQH